MKTSRKSRKSIRSSIFIGILAGSIFSGSSAFADILISTKAQLEAINPTSNENYILSNDIELIGAPLNGSSYVASEFWGTFNGNNKTISGLIVPLFNIISGDGEARVSNLTLATPGVLGNGALANSTLLGATIENVQVVGNVTGTTSNVGGIVGTLNGGISGSTFTGNVTGATNTGGLVGTLYGNVSESTFSGEVTGGTNTGGLVGTLYGNVSESTFSGEVTGESYVGGLVGLSNGNITLSTAIGDVSSRTIVTLGDSETDISLVYSAYTSGSNIGGLVGSSTGNISSSSASVDVSSTATISIGSAIVDISLFDVSASAGSNIGGLAGSSTGNISSSSATGDVSSTATISLGHAGDDISTQYTFALAGSYIGGLVGSSTGNISSSFASGDVSSTATFSTGDATDSLYLFGTSAQVGSYIGGLVGNSVGDISNSHTYVSGDVSAIATFLFGEAAVVNYPSSSPYNGDLVGGLAGSVTGNISNSYAFVDGDVTGDGAIGGLVGSIEGNIYNSYSEINGDVTGTDDYVGGLAGVAYSTISNSYANITGDVTGLSDRVGGLSGRSDGDISNSHAIVGGSVTGLEDVGGFVGFIDNGVDISDSYFQGIVADSYAEAGWFIGGFTNCVSCTILDSFSAGDVSNELFDSVNVFGRSPYALPTASYSCAAEIIDGFLSCLVGGDAPRPLISNLGADSPLGEEFTVDEFINSGMPYLISLRENYRNSTPDEGDGGTSPRRDRLEREFREVVEAATPSKIEKTLGFKSDTTLPKDAVITFLQPTDKIDIAKVKSFEITPNAIVRVSTKTEEALQISLKSESKAPVELWVLSQDGKWLLAGVITFDKDGKAIMPPLQFKNTGDYSLVFSTPSADSAKASAPLNIGGQVLVSVS